jgi:hypothetical protein
VRSHAPTAAFASLAIVESWLVIADIGDLVRNDQVMLRIDRRLDIIADDARSRIVASLS